MRVTLVQDLFYVGGLGLSLRNLHFENCCGVGIIQGFGTLFLFWVAGCWLHLRGSVFGIVVGFVFGLGLLLWVVGGC